MDELLDVFDDKWGAGGIKFAGKALRSEVHEKDLYHKHVGVLIMNEKGELLFQRRSPDKKINPNKWTRTGGHVDSGEEPIIAAQREVKEEIGVEISIDKFELMGIKKVSVEGNKNFTYSYFARVNYKLEDYTIQKEEVSDLKYMTIEEMEEKYKNNDEDYVFLRWKDFDKIIEYLKRKRDERSIADEKEKESDCR